MGNTEKITILVLSKSAGDYSSKTLLQDGMDSSYDSSDRSTPLSSEYLIGIYSKNIDYSNDNSKINPNSTIYKIGSITIPSIKNVPGDLSYSNFPYDAFEVFPTGIFNPFPLKYEVMQDTTRDVKYISMKSRNNDEGPYVFFISENREVLDRVNSSDFSNRVFTFHVNPNHLDASYKKVVTEIKTRGGWEVQTWGNALTELSIKGRSGCLIPELRKKSPSGEDVTVTRQNMDITKSTAWIRLNELKQLYLDFNSRANTPIPYTLGITFQNKIYSGYFTNFSGPSAKSQDMLVVDYSFSFKITGVIGCIP